MSTRFQFPLTDQDYYTSKVTFQAIETIPPSIKLTGGPDVDVSNIEESDNVALSAIDAIIAQAPSTDIKATTVEPEQKIFRDQCSLFLPQAITFQDGVVFDEFALGRVGGSVAAAVSNGSSISNAVRSGLQQNMSALTDVFNAAPTSDIARLAASRLARIGGKEEIAAGVKSALRVSANPNKRLLFKEVNIREFSFSFKLVPTTQDEAREITRIIKFFRSELYPDDAVRVVTSGVSVPIGYKFPNTFEIVMRHKGVPIAHRILPAYLVSMQTTYNPQSMGFFEDGNFTESEITLNFRESRTLAKNDITNEGY